MDTTTQDHRTITKFADETHLLTWLEAFLIDRKAQGLASRTVEFYQLKLQNFSSYCETLAISYIDQIDPNTLRRFLLHLEDTGHNPGGIHAHYRALRAFLKK
jgi:integrase/recombinase XerD